MRGIKSLRRSPGFHVALGFASLLVLGTLLAVLLGVHPTPEEQQSRCNAECKQVGKQGQLEPLFASTRSSRGNAPLECKCVWYRTR